MSSVVTLVTRSSGDLKEVSTLVSGLLRPLRPITRENFMLTDSGLVEVEPDVPVDPALRARPVMNTAATLEPTQLIRDLTPTQLVPAPAAPAAPAVPADASAFNDVTVRRSSAPTTAPRSSLHQVPLPDTRPTSAADLLGVTLAGVVLLSRGTSLSAVARQAASITSKPAVVESVDRGPVVKALESLK